MEFTELLAGEPGARWLVTKPAGKHNRVLSVAEQSLHILKVFFPFPPLCPQSQKGRAEGKEGAQPG